LDLIEFQEKIRMEVAQSMPLQDIRANRFRSRKEVELIRKTRDRKEKKKLNRSSIENAKNQENNS